MTLLEHYALEREEGRKEGREEGKLDILLSLVREKLLTVKDAAVRAGMTETEFLQKMAEK